jgi:hypothetical protein
MERKRTGISNRETPAEEHEERLEHPPEKVGSPEPQDAAGRTGEAPLEAVPNRHTSHKAGARSVAQKESASKYADRGMPPTRKKAGAFGREPQDVAADTGSDQNREPSESAEDSTEPRDRAEE